MLKGFSECLMWVQFKIFCTRYVLFSSLYVVVMTLSLEWIDVIVSSVNELCHEQIPYTCHDSIRQISSQLISKSHSVFTLFNWQPVWKFIVHIIYLIGCVLPAGSWQKSWMFHFLTTFWCVLVLLSPTSWAEHTFAEITSYWCRLETLQCTIIIIIIEFL